jgi:hypothetical protein
MLAISGAMALGLGALFVLLELALSGVGVAAEVVAAVASTGLISSLCSLGNNSI